MFIIKIKTSIILNVSVSLVHRLNLLVTVAKHVITRCHFLCWMVATITANWSIKRYTVVPRYNDHLYNGNFDFRRNFFGNGSFLMKIYYIIMEFALSDTDDDSRRRNAFLTHFSFIKTTEKKQNNKLFTCKNFQLAVNRYVHCRKRLTCKSKETRCAMTM